MPDACTLGECEKDRQGTFQHAPAEDSRCGRATIARSVFVVASGDNRVSETKVAEKVGAPLAWTDGDFVRSATGYAIGSVAPIGYSKPVKLLLDQDLRRFETVWAAGGTPFAVFPIRPDSVLSTWPGARIRLPRARRLVRRSKHGEESAWHGAPGLVPRVWC